MKRILILLAVLALIASFFYFDLNEILSLEWLKSSQAQLDSWWQESPLLLGSIFFALYLIVTALSLPGAAIMTLAGGAIFGLLWGTIMVSFASSIGATLAFLIGRYLFRENVQQRFGARLRAINKGVEREGAFYLFSLRLIPIFPFFLINLVMALTPMKAWTFYWVSQIGMLAGTLVYVNAGTQLGQIESAGDILSAGLILSFVLIGIFPLIARKLVDWSRARRVYHQWRKPRRFDRNLVVIGGGATGLVSSYIAAAAKASVTLIESHKLGGDCLNTGCVPSKALIRSAKLAHQIQKADRYGLTPSTPNVNMQQVMERVRASIERIEPHDSVERYTGLGVDVQLGQAKIIDPWTVEISYADGQTRTLTSRAIVLATGAEPVVPNLPGLEECGYLTSDTLWDRFASYNTPLEQLVVLGGGPIGCELTQAFARLGCKVTQVEMADRLMLNEDPDVAEFIARSLRDEGVDVLMDHKAVRAENNNGEKALIVEHQGQEKRIVFDELICAVGRKPRIEGFGLDALGIPTDKTILTNDFLQTLYPNIYAAGDVAGPYQFTHVGAHQAWYAAVNALFGEWRRFRVNYAAIPWVTYTDPEVAHLGLNETTAAEQDIAFEVTRFDLAELDRAITDSGNKGFIKVLTPPGKDRILGVTIVGEHAGELLAEFVLAKNHNLGLGKILGTIHSYPTMAEANKYVAGEWRRNHISESLLKWAKRYHRWKRG